IKRPPANLACSSSFSTDHSTYRSPKTIHLGDLVDLFDRSDVLFAHAKDRILPSENGEPAVLALHRDTHQRLAPDVVVLAVHERVIRHLHSFRRGALRADKTIAL